MVDWVDGIAGTGMSAAVFWILTTLIVLVIILFILRMIRSLSSGTFVAGGRNRKTRLAVMDATAVDSHRRLVLVRRDDVEHLLLIGGPTDLLVESDIRLSAPRRPALTANGAPEQPARPRPAAPVQPMPPQPVHPAAPTQPAAPRRLDEPARPPQPLAAPTTASTPAPARPVIPVAPPPPRAAAVPVPAPVAKDPVDDSLMQELEFTLDEPAAPPASTTVQPLAKPATPSLDDEMARLLGELSNHKR